MDNFELDLDESQERNTSYEPVGGQLTHSQSSDELVGQRPGVGSIVYHQFMDVPLGGLSIDVESAIADPSLKLSTLSAERQIMAANATTNYYRVQSAKVDTQIAMVKHARKQVKLGEEAYKYSSAVSKLQGSQNDAETDATLTENKIEINRNRTLVSEASKKQWQYKGRKARKKIEEYNQILEEEGLLQNIGDVSTGDYNSEDIIDVDF